MKKIVFVLLCATLLQNISFANRQHVHQRLVIEGYKLLKMWLNNNSVPFMNDKIGDYSNIGANPWEQGFITTGAWREDVEDVVYHYSLNKPPAISGFTANLIQALGWALGNDNNDGWISITHFWDADAGDETATNMIGSFYIWPTHNVWQVTIPNAYQKMKHYVNGDFDLRIQIMIRDFPNGNGVPCAAQWAWVNFRYGYLPTYFNIKVLRVSKIEWGDGSVTNYPNLPVFTADHYYGLNPQTYTQFKDNICWEILGRMCHLLQDMGVPAHANVDPHGDNSDLRIDSFENNFGDIGWTAELVYNLNQGVLDPFVCSNPTHFLMYTTQQQANHFASNGPHMHQRNDVFAGNSLPEEITYLNTLNVSDYGNPIEMGETLPIENISNKMIPQMIRATAGLLYWFAKEANILPPPPLSAYISGPSTAPCTTGTWNANVSGGYPPYSYQWYHMYTSGGGELAKSNTTEGGITPDKPIDTWYPVGTNSPTLNYYLCRGDSYLRVDVMDSHNGTASATYYVAGSGVILPKSENAEDLTKEYKTELLANHPNPFNPSTRISYSLQNEGRVSLIIYNTLGQKVKTLVDEIKPAGNYEAEFNAAELPSEIYIYRIQAGEYVSSKKMLLI